MTNKKKIALNSKIIIGIVIVLVAAIAILAFINKKNTSTDLSKLIIELPNQKQAVMTIDEIKKMPSITVETTIKSTNKGDESGKFTGVPLANVLEKANQKAAQNEDLSQKNLSIEASDGFSSALSMAEFDEPEDALLIYALDGQDLKGPDENNGSGPLRLLIVSDPFGNRSAKNITKIVVN